MPTNIYKEIINAHKKMLSVFDLKKYYNIIIYNASLKESCF